MNDVIDELYRVFKAYRIGDDFFGCIHCVLPRDSEDLRSTPLQKLTVEDLDRYAFKAMTTWGDVRHFKHFLPRLLELCFDQYLQFSFPEVLLGKLNYADWKSWPSLEQNAVQKFMMSFWQYQLQLPGDFPADERIDAVLGGLSQVCDSLMPYLDSWPSLNNEIAAMHLSQFIHNASDDILSSGHVKHLWGKPSKHGDKIVKWLLSDAALEVLSPFRQGIDDVFPYVMDQLDGIRSA